MHLATCPAEADLLRLFRENLPETEVAAVEEHVLHCGPCLEKLKTLAGTEDSLADLLRRHTPTPDFAASPVVAELMKQLKSLRASSASPESQGVAMIPLTCTACRKKLKVKAELAGKKIKCPGCGQVLAVAAPAPVAAPAGGSEDRTVLPTPEPASQAPPADAGRRQTQAGASMFEATREHEGEAGGPNANLTDFLSPPQSGDELGRLGKYRILKVLGHGGMGVVYKAEDPVLKRTVAIKAMLPGVAAGASAGQRFLREAQTMAAVEHDHIVRIHDVAEERGVPFLAMEFLKGEPLDVRLERDGKLAAEETVRIGREIAAGLQAAHERGLIHRDIKPANVWLEAPRGRVKILDFGLARSAEQESMLTQQGAIVGTPSFMAPEQARGDPVDARSDLFSLGVVLYRLCAGRQPFQGRDAISTLMAVATDEPPPPIQVNPELPPELSDLVMALLQKDPERRPAPAAAVVEALQGLEEQLHREQGPQAPLSPRLPRERGLTSKRRQLPLLVGSLVLLIGLVGLGLWAAGVFRFSTDKGDLVFESDDPDFAFAAAKNGGVTLEDRKTQRTYRVKATPRERDEYELEVLDKDAGLSFKTRTFTVKRGDKVALKTWFERKKEVAAPRSQAAGTPPIEDAWFKQVAAMPAEKRVEAVAAKLKERNPGFDGKLNSRIEKWEVTGLVIRGRVSDLSPLKGIPLTYLDIGNTAVSDLSPLKGMPLTGLRCGGTKVSDLSPLKDMKLTELLSGSTKVSDLSPLKDMPLTYLEIGSTQVSDLSPLKGMPLRLLDIGNTAVSDLSPLKDMKLTDLKCGGTQVSDLSPLKDLKLTRLDCNHTQVSDLSPLKGMPLTGLICWGAPVSDLSSLKGMKLTFLQCAETQVSDLSPLKGMPLTSLGCYVTKVSDLSPLKGMKLTFLRCDHTQVSDLSPLKEMKLTDLWCSSTQVSDLSPLKGMPLKYLNCDFKPERDAEILRSLKTLETINGKRAAEFWKEVDAKAANKKP